MKKILIYGEATLPPLCFSIETLTPCFSEMKRTSPEKSRASSRQDCISVDDQEPHFIHEKAEIWHF